LFLILSPSIYPVTMNATISVDPGNARNRCRHVLTVLAAGLATIALQTALERPAAAQAPFGGPKLFAVTGEDMAGYSTEHISYHDANARDFEASRNRFSLAFQSGGAKLGFHYFVLKSLSLGGVLGYESRAGSNTYQDNPGTWTRDLASESTFVFQPKVGYVLMFTPVVGFWFRAGPGVRYDRYRSNEYEPGDKTSNTLWMGSADVLFVVSPVEHFGLFLGPSADVSFIGKHNERSVTDGAVTEWTHDASYWRLSLGLGLIGYL
jgi:hypothetical protein